MHGMTEKPANSPPDIKTWWKHRRRHSYMAFGGLVGEAALIKSMTPEQIEAGAPVLTAFAWVFGAVILAYVAASTWEDIAKIRAAAR